MTSQSKLKWRCRRGVRELDVLFTQFFEQEYPGLSDAEKLAFEELLEVQDPAIMDWLFAKSLAENDRLQGIISRMQSLSHSISRR